MVNYIPLVGSWQVHIIQSTKKHAEKTLMIYPPWLTSTIPHSFPCAGDVAGGGRCLWHSQHVGLRLRRCHLAGRPGDHGGSGQRMGIRGENPLRYILMGCRVGYSKKCFYKIMFFLKQDPIFQRHTYHFWACYRWFILSEWLFHHVDMGLCVSLWTCETLESAQFHRSSVISRRH